MKTLLSLALVLSTYAFNASAVSLEFAFDVNSSGVSIYPCDAGIKHEPHSQRICYDRVAQESCDPKLCTTEEQCNCVCTGGATGDDGEYRMDFMKASYTDWSENGSYAPSSVSSVAVSAGQNDFNRIFTNKTEWDKQLTSLTFNLGSERYGSEYYLDVCYRGPQIEYWMAYQNSTNQNSNYWPNFNIKLQATVTDMASTNGLRYSQLANLKVKTITTCDVQGEGQYIYAHSGVGGSSNNGNNGNNNGNNGNHNGIENGNGANGNHGNGNNGNGNGNNGGNSNGQYVYDNAQAHQINGVTGGDKNFTTAFTSFNAGGNLFLLNDWINLGTAKTPRFCKVRYVFTESARNNSVNVLSQIRKWQNHKARICTYTDIQESINL